ncbi:MAG: hypothetical protein JSV66_13570 [Trueperaceae bacterium]|nr:MAG: hypothetical protein JSV66_13570 [Trueperaceae bacterium]
MLGDVYIPHLGTRAQLLRAGLLLSILLTLLTACQPDAIVTLSPHSASLDIGESRVFTALVFGGVLELQWETSGGSVAGTGNTVTYQAPGMSGTYELTVRSTQNPEVSASATIDVHPTMSLIASSTSVEVAGSVSVKAIVEGTSNTGISWDATGGSLSSSGSVVNWTAPGCAGSHRITASSTADPHVRASIDLEVVSTGPDLCQPNPGSLLLSSFVGETATGSVTLRNTGDQELSYAVSATDTFLSADPDSGTVSAGGNQTVSIRANCGATAGSQSGELTVSSNDSSDGEHTVDVKLLCSVDSHFSIDLGFLGNGTTQERKLVFEGAAARWMQLITGDLPDSVLTIPAGLCSPGAPSVSTMVDDLLIHIFIEPIDGVGGILGSAGPCLLRERSEGSLPIYGIMRFDSADLSQLEVSGQLEEVILHEMGHVLGFGILWEYTVQSGLQEVVVFDLLDYQSADPEEPCNSVVNFTVQPHYTGAAARNPYAATGGYGDVPVEDEFGPGTQCGHWDEQSMSAELMTGFLEKGTTPLSAITVFSLADLGYQVDASGADPYDPSPCWPTCLRTRDEGLVLEETLLRPIGTVTAQGAFRLFGIP